MVSELSLPVLPMLPVPGRRQGGLQSLLHARKPLRYRQAQRTRIQPLPQRRHPVGPTSTSSWNRSPRRCALDVLIILGICIIRRCDRIHTGEANGWRPHLGSPRRTEELPYLPQSGATGGKALDLRGLPYNISLGVQIMQQECARQVRRLPLPPHSGPDRRWPELHIRRLHQCRDAEDCPRSARRRHRDPRHLQLPANG